MSDDSEASQLRSAWDGSSIEKKADFLEKLGVAYMDKDREDMVPVLGALLVSVAADLRRLARMESDDA